MDKHVIYIYNGILLSHKKNEILPSVTIWMDPDGIMLSEISQTKTTTVYSHLYVESKKQTNEQTKQDRNRSIHIENKLLLPESSGVVGVGENCEGD